MQKTLFNYPSAWYFQIIIITLATVGVYYHTLDVPFYLDDFSSIQENAFIYNWQGTLVELWRVYHVRIIGYLSFALNYQANQFQVAGYHIVNIIIHLFTGFIVLALMRGIVQTPLLIDRLNPTVKQWLPLIVALLFVLHPLQIQSVTYIVQRLASLAALFYIAAMACFIQARLSLTNKIRILWIISCILLAILAFLTKQNTVTLPIALLLLELIFFPFHRKRLLMAVGVALFALGVLWIILATALNYNPFSLQAMIDLTQETSEISRESYLSTQFSVLWTYIKLFFYPVGLHLDYQYPITEHFIYQHPNYNLIARLMHSQALWMLIGHLTLIAIAIYNSRRLPLFAFGILFYYVAHLIESSIIPIRDVIFEHRTYLPNLGLFIICAWLLLDPIAKSLNRNLIIVIIFTLILVLAVMTWQRNELWRDPIALWKDNIVQSPEKKRAWVILGKHLLQQSQIERQSNVAQSNATLATALDTLQQSIQTVINPDGSQTKSYSVEAVLNMVVAYKLLKQYDRAMSWIDQALTLPNLSAFNRAKFLINAGNVNYELKKLDQAETFYREAIEYSPDSLIARGNLATILAVTNRIEEAKSMYHAVLAIDPQNQQAIESLEKIERLQ